jgi:hypothetical protein
VKWTEVAPEQKGRAISEHEPDRVERRHLTRALVSAEESHDSSVVDALRRLCRAVARDLGLTGAVVNMLTHAGANAVVAASDEASRRLGELQLEYGEGPGQESFDGGRPSLVPDLAAVGRWPGYGPAAHAAGAGAMFVFPLQVGAARFGLLTLFADRSRVLTRDQLERCLGFASLATELLIDGPGANLNGALDPDLLNALELRTEVYQAQGMVMVQLDITLNAALARMRAHAFSYGVDLGQLSADIVAGRTQFTNDEGGPS